MQTQCWLRVKLPSREQWYLQSSYGTHQKKWRRHSERFSEMRLWHSSHRKLEGFFRKSEGFFWELKVSSKEAEGFFEEHWVWTHISFRNAVQLHLWIFQGLHLRLPELRLFLSSCVNNGKAEQQQKGFRKRASFLKTRTIYIWTRMFWQ